MRQKCEIILASASPRRKELLSRLPCTFTVRAADVDETVPDETPPRRAVMELARRKARAVFCPGGHAAVIGADTLVSLGGKLLGKPGSKERAYEMLRTLSGRRHQMSTGVCVVLPSGVCITFCSAAEVTFRALTDEEIYAYIATGEPLDRAGAYAIQGGAAPFVKAYRGDYDGIVGLPVRRLGTLLARLGVLC